MQNMTLNQMKKVDIRKINRNDLRELRIDKINLDDLPEIRFKDHVHQIENPYCYKVGKVAVKESYSENGETLENIFIGLLKKSMVR